MVIISAIKIQRFIRTSNVLTARDLSVQKQIHAALVSQASSAVLSSVKPYEYIINAFWKHTEQND